MNTEALAELANVAVAAATVVLAVAWLTHVVEWAAAREVRPSTREQTAALVTAGAAGSAPAPTDDSAARRHPSRADQIGRIGLTLTVLGTALLAAGVIARGAAAGRAPWGNMYETSYMLPQGHDRPPRPGDDAGGEQGGAEHGQRQPDPTDLVGARGVPPRCAVVRRRGRRACCSGGHQRRGLLSGRRPHLTGGCPLHHMRQPRHREHHGGGCDRDVGQLG
jgi:hypothetical protein